MEVRNDLPGTVYLCFQVAEENTGGARYIVYYLKKQGGVDSAVSIHTAVIPIPHGTFATRSGLMMAGDIDWELTVTGRGGHTSQPWSAIYPIKPAAEFLLWITSLQGNAFSAMEPLVISTGDFHAGSGAVDIIPETAVIKGTIRYFNQDNLEAVPARMEKIAQDIASTYGATAKLDADIEHS